jgi:glyoxylase-like metal-dependent hydrolase (beta-lactamase superfamily II)
MTLVEGEQGVIVIDPLISAETAAAALGLYREHRGDRPVTAVIYSHSHVDHFGGVQGVAAEGMPTDRSVCSRRPSTSPIPDRRRPSTASGSPSSSPRAPRRRPR